MKANIQLVQVNNSYGNQYFIPYSVGLLQAYCEQFDDIRENFNFSKFIYKQETDLESQAKSFKKVDILAQSCYIWNWQFNLTFAELVKKYNPEILIILGGPQIPDDSSDFFEKYPFVDILCHGEGELVFHDILKKYMGDKKYGDLEGVSYNNVLENKTEYTPRRDRAIDLKDIPSPYLEGIFSDLMEEDVVWQASWETNRGCPYRCTFCAWGAEYYNKIRKFPFEERLTKEIKWFSENKLDLVFGCDANFGVFQRDVDIAKSLVEFKNRYGYPKKFRVCNAKNSNDRVFQISKLFDDADMAKGTSMSVQSMDTDTLDIIRRKNIGIDKFKDLMGKFNESTMSTYTEVILGLPGESYDTFINGFDTLLHSGQHSQIHVYNCTLLNNTEMADPEYIKEHEIETIETPIFRAHTDKKAHYEVQELEKIIVKTKTMTREEWKKGFQYSKVIQTFHTMGLLQYMAISLVNNYGCNYSDFYNTLIDYAYENPKTLVGVEITNNNRSIEKLFSGIDYGQLLPSYNLDILWPPEEASFLRIAENIDTFYDEIYEFINYFLDKFNFVKDRQFLDDLLSLQKEVIVHYDDDGKNVLIDLNYNIDSNVLDTVNGIPTELVKYSDSKVTTITKHWKDAGCKEEFARNVVWYGRKGGKFINEIL
tara:strand:+ start:4300 stop:6252 length:1953 start_codon:yes stop_codon:yes gene_type:complete